MPSIDGPFAATLDPNTGGILPEGKGSTRRLSQIATLFADGAAAAAAAIREDVVVYSTSSAPVPAAEGHLGFSLTRIEPGDVAGEFYMTHGHVHVRAEGETYVAQSGVGGIALTRNGEAVWLPMTPGVVGYIPPGWTHRSVNTGTVPFVFLSVYPALSGQDYDFVTRHGVGARVLRDPHGFRVIADDGTTVAHG